MSKIFNNAKKVQNISGNPNLIINGNFNIWQRGTLHSSTGYNADRWVGIINNSVSFSKINAVNLKNSSFAMRAATTKDNSSFVLKQIIETNNVIFIRGKTVVLSFYIKKPDTYKGNINNWNSTLKVSAYYSADNIDSIVGAIEIPQSVQHFNASSEWTRCSVVFEAPNTAQTLSINFTPSANTLLDNSAIDITQVKLELGDIPTNYDDSLYIDELRKCQRYYQKIELDFEAGSQNNQQFGTTVPLASEMRTSNPSITYETQRNRGLNNLTTSISSNKQAIKIKGNSTSNNVLLNAALSIDGEVAYGAPPAQIADAQSIRDIDNDLLTIFWTEPNNNGLDITSYNIKYGTSPTSLDNSVTTTIPSGDISGVLDYAAYYFTVQAINSMGAGQTSTIYISGPDMQLPQPPTNLSAEWGYNNHTINWDPPSDDGGTDVLHYSIQRATNASFTQNLFTNSTDISPNPSTQITLANPQSSNNYYFRVAAINAIGTGDYSDSIFLQRTVPSTPLSLSTSAINSGVILTWSNPANNGGSAINGYVINHSPTSGFEVSSVSNIGTASTTTITSLTNNLNRYFRVAATNSIGNSEWSPIMVATPNQPPSSAQPPRDLSAAWVDPTLIGISFNGPVDDGGTPVLNYNIQIASNAGFTNNLVNFNTASANTRSTYNVAIATGADIASYYARACSVNAVGTGQYSDPIQINKGLAPAPTNILATAGNGSVNLRWTPSSVSSGIPVTGFLIHRSTSSLFSSVVANPVPVSNSNQQFYATNLANNTNYYFRIAAITTSGIGPYSSTASSTPRAPASVPSAPLLYRVDRLAQTGLRVLFYASSNNGGAPITDYTLAYTTGLSSSVNLSASGYFNTNPPIQTFSLSSSAARRYQSLPIAFNSGTVIAMKANNTAGSSAWTNLLFREMYLTSPSVVTGVTYTENIADIGSGIGTITWKDPLSWGGEDNDLYKTYNINLYYYDRYSYYSRYSRYRLQYSLTQLEYNGNNNNSVTVSGLIPGKQYYASVSAKNRTYSSSARNVFFVPSTLVRPRTGGWTLSVPTPITDSSVNRNQSWDYFRGYSRATNMDNDDRQGINNIWASLEMYKTSNTRFFGSYLRYSNSRKPSDDGLWIKATFPSPGVYVSLIQYATPLPGIYIPTDFTGYNNSKTILTESLAINSLNGALLQYSMDDTNWTTITTLSVPNASTIHSHQIAPYPLYCRYIRIYLPYTTANFNKRLAVGLLNFE